MLYRMRQALYRRWFDHRCRDILRTTPLDVRPGEATVVSMVSHRDVIMYLASVKSFYPQLPGGRVVVLDDGSLTAEDKAVLGHHIPGCAIEPALDVDTASCPSYISWRRLLYITESIRTRYTVQLDSDLVTRAPIPEVVQAVAGNESFILGTWRNQRIGPMRETWQNAQDVPSDHVQASAERNFDRLEGFDRLDYVRGCAGFAGFARASFTRSDVEDFSRQMYEILGPVWSRWGSEQTTSNFLVANSPNPSVLPFPKYAGYRPARSQEESALIHFNGTNRFKGGTYVGIVRNMIRDMSFVTA